MKKLFYFALPLALGLGACNMAGDEDYDNMANDICDCMNKNTASVSDGMKSAIIDAVSSGKNAEQAMQEIAMKDPEQAMKDGQAMIDAGPKVETCITDLEKKYENVYSNETESEVEKRLLETLKKNKSCEWTYSLYKMSVDMK